LVERKIIGRRGTLSASTVLTGVFLYASTTATNSDALLGWNCAYNFTSNIMYAVLYAYTVGAVHPARSLNTDTCHSPKSSQPRTAELAMLSLQRRIESSASWRPSSPCSRISRLLRQCTPVAPCSSLQVSFASSYPTKVRARPACEPIYCVGLSKHGDSRVAHIGEYSPGWRKRPPRDDSQHYYTYLLRLAPDITCFLFCLDSLRQRL
jgi:hypothetical protein